jgi:uncharacterized protein YjdB
MKKAAILTGILLGIMILATPVMAEENEQAVTSSTGDIQVTYHTHIQNIGWEWNWASDGNTSGTFGRGLRLEGIQIQLTGDLPEGAKILYRTQIQNVGWEKTWTETGRTSGTVGQGLRLEGIQMKLENLPGYSIEYRTHVQNVGWEENWAQDGETAGTVGRGLRLEGIQIRLVKEEEADLTAYDALLTKIEGLKSYHYTVYSWDRLQKRLTTYAVSPKNTLSEVAEAVSQIKDAYNSLEALSDAITYKTAGTFGSSSSSSPTVISSNVIISTKDVILQNMKIQGDLIIAEGVGTGMCTLTNVYVSGNIYIRGGGGDDNEYIEIMGGDCNKIYIQDTYSKKIRIDTNLTDLDLIVEEDAEDDIIILDGGYKSIALNAFNVGLYLNGTSNVDELTVQRGGLGSLLHLDDDVDVDQLNVNGHDVAVNGLGTVEHANVTTERVTFERAPLILIVDDEVQNKPEVPTMVESITVSGANKAKVITKDEGTLQMSATVAPTDASNPAVTWSVINETGEAEIDSEGLLKAEKDGTVLVRATAKDGSRIYGQLQIAITNQLQPTIWANAYSIETETVNPQIEVNLINDVFTSAASLPEFWDIDTGDTTLTLDKITLNTSMKVTIQFKGTTKPGTITIKPQTDILSSGDEANEIAVEAPVISVTDITLSDDEIILTRGQTYQLTASIEPENATNKTMTWRSEDTSVATVAGGLVTAVSEGTKPIYIIVRSEDGLKEASCKVTVVEKPYMTALTAVLDDGSDTEVKATGDPLSLALTQGTATKKIVVDMNEEVALGDDPNVYFNGTDTVYGTITRDAADPTKIIITPSGANGTAALAGTFTFQVNAGAVKDLRGNENEAVSFKLVVSS